MILRAFLRRFARRREGSVSLISAAMLPILIAMVGMVAEYGNGLVQKVENQRVADAAAFAAATAYQASSSNSLTSAADAVASRNNIPNSGVSASLVTSPTGDGNHAVKVTVTTSQPLLLSSILGNSGSALSVSATSYAEVKGGAAGCIIALSGSGTGISLTSAAGITADACAVDSDAAVSLISASTITTIQVNYDSTSPPSIISASAINAPSGKTVTISKATTADPLAGNSAVTTAVARLTTGTVGDSSTGVENMTSPGAPSVSASSNNVTLASSTLTATLPGGCAASGSGATRTITCASGGTYNFGTVSVSSTGNLTFAITGSSPTTFNFAGGVSASSSAKIAFPAGTYNIKQGVSVISSSQISFGAGTFNIGPGASTCTDGFKYSLCIESSTSITFGGPSSFTLGGGVYAGSSAAVTLGSGTTNSFDLGASNSGYAVQTSSSSSIVFGDATGAGDVFQAVGIIDAVSAACVELPNAADHDINGSIAAQSASNTTFGGGVYTVSGYMLDQSASGGGGCLSSTAGTGGTGVTFVLGATTTPGSGTCSGYAICVTSASGLSLNAPTSGTYAGLAVIGPTSSSNTAGALFQSASSGNMGGAFYLPNGPITVSSAAALGGGSTTCLMLIGSQISVTSASAIGSTCTGLGGTGGGGGVTLVE
ncbi:MAG TPA: pilus assembly protein TadG-related protein [Caulobacteraceae bacterium]|jgi:Flp pilus assembly protein TadG